MFNSYTETTLHFHPDICVNCSRCTEVCPHRVFSKEKGQYKLVYPEKCMECGACAMNCPVQAITVESGVGCAWAMISAALRGKSMDEGTCGCGEGCCGEKEF